MADEITQSEVEELVGAAEIIRLEGMDSGGQYYWQAYIPDPVNASIQVTGATEDEATENMNNAAWELVQNRQTSIEAAETPVEAPEVSPE